MNFRMWALSAVLFVEVALLCLGQDVQTATLVGTVTDSTGSVVPGAGVTITNTETQVVIRVVTNAEGAYYVPFLGIGTYNLIIEARGFKKYVRNGFSGWYTTNPDFQGVLRLQF